MSSFNFNSVLWLGSSLNFQSKRVNILYIGSQAVLLAPTYRPNLTDAQVEEILLDQMALRAKTWEPQRLLASHQSRAGLSTLQMWENQKLPITAMQP